AKGPGVYKTITLPTLFFPPFVSSRLRGSTFISRARTGRPCHFLLRRFIPPHYIRNATRISQRRQNTGHVPRMIRQWGQSIQLHHTVIQCEADFLLAGVTYHSHRRPGLAPAERDTERAAPQFRPRQQSENGLIISDRKNDILLEVPFIGRENYRPGQATA